MQEGGYFYIMTNVHNTVLYCGATNDLYKRVHEHRNGLYSDSFTSRYNVDKLVYFEILSLVSDAFAREKQVKAGSRKKKIALVESINPQWQDLLYLLSSNAVEELIRLKKLFKQAQACFTPRNTYRIKIRQGLARITFFFYKESFFQSYR